MYYEEDVIDGVLCWRGTPESAWIARSRQELTAMLLEAREVKASEVENEAESQRVRDECIGRYGG